MAAPDGRAAMAGFENPALATGGTGDVLAGTIGSLLAQGCEPYEAACLAVYLHGLAAEHVRERLGDSGLLASDLPFEIARVRRHLTGLGRRAARSGAWASFRGGPAADGGAVAPVEAWPARAADCRPFRAAPGWRSTWTRWSRTCATIRVLAGRGALVAPVLKADAYGHGLEACARALERAGAGMLCVATLDEALVTRRAGVRVPLLVLFPIPAARPRPRRS